MCLCWCAYASVANAQQFLCDNLDTIAACRRRLEQNLSGDDAAAARDKLTTAQDDVKKKTETGLADLATGLSSSVKDFLPLLQLGGVLGNVKTNDDTGVVTVALNTPFVASGGLTKDHALQVKALIETKPKLFDPIKQGLPTTGRDDLEKDLLDTPNRQNVTLQVGANVTTKRLGRNFEQYRGILNELFAGILGAGSKTVASETKEAEFERALNRLTRTNGALDVLQNTTRLFEIPDQPGGKTGIERRRDIELAVFRIAENAVERAAIFDAEVKASGLYLFGQLVNNQPQLHFEFSRVFRDTLFGPQQYVGRVSYEMGLGNNVNAFLDAAGAACRPVSKPECVTALRTFTKSPNVKAAIKAGARLSLSADFTTNDEYAYQLPEHRINLAYGRSSKAAFGADFGRLLGVEDDGTASARVDASVRGEWCSDETLSKNRLVASVTLTKKFGDLSVPFGLRYASRTEFLSDFDHGISANVGLKFNLFPGIK